MPDLQPELALDPDTAFYILLKAREFDAKEEAVDPDEGSNPSDDKAIDILEFEPDDAVEEEVAAAIDALNEDQKLDLIALAWIGRGDFSLDEWAEARESAREVDQARVAGYLLDTARLAHLWYHKHHVLNEPPRLMNARLLLARATQLVVRNGLALLGLSAPERM